MNISREELNEVLPHSKSEQENESLSEQLQQVQDSRVDMPLDYSEISFREKVYLGALFLAFGDEDSLIINPRQVTGTNKLTPTMDLDLQLFRFLVDSRVILVDTEFSIDGFDKKSLQHLNDFQMLRLIYSLNVQSLGTESKILDEMINPDLDLTSNSDVALELWYEIAVHECIEYLFYQMEKVDFDFSPGKKTFSVLQDMLSFLSVSQVYSVIYASIAHIAKRYLEGTMTRKLAANSVVSYMQKRADRIRLDGWTCFEYKRLYDLPQSALSSYFFDRVLKIGDKGFSCVPSIDVFITK